MRRLQGLLVLLWAPGCQPMVALGSLRLQTDASNLPRTSGIPSPGSNSAVMARERL